MRVLHVITTINRGGAENHLVELVRSQMDQGLDVAVAYLKGNHYWAAALRDMGVRTQALRLSYYGELKPAFRLRSLIKGWAPDILHVHMPPAELYSRLALLFLNSAPVMVISKHNDEPFFRSPCQGAVGRWVARRAARVIAISDAVNAYTRNHLGLSAERVTTVHYGLDPSAYEQISEGRQQDVRREWGIPSGAWVIGTVARLVPQKALHVLLKAYAQYLVKARQESRLVLVGCGPLEGELKASSHQLGLNDNIVWAGFRADIPGVMNAFDAFVLTSSYEGFGLVLLEAMAASRPIVASSVSAIPEIVLDGRTGLLCKSGDPAAFAQALLRLEDPRVRARLGSAGHNRVLSHFTPEQMTERTLSVYQKCLSSRKHGNNHKTRCRA